MTTKDVLLGELQELQSYLQGLDVFTPRIISKVIKALRTDIDNGRFNEWRESSILCAFENHTDMSYICDRIFEDVILDWSDHMSAAGELGSDNID